MLDKIVSKREAFGSICKPLEVERILVQIAATICITDKLEPYKEKLKKGVR